MEERSTCGIFKSIFLDMGDEQSIENDLSTYSSHLLNMKQFVRHADSESLILIDEFGSGTEPIIGGAIAESVLESLNSSGCYGVITTHYTNLKHFASSADGIINGAMLFDTGRLQPMFQLATGRPGSSFAFEIASKTGLPESILQKAKEKVGQDHIDFEKNLRELIRDKRYWENKRQKIRVSEKRLAELVEKYNTELQDTEKLRKKIITEAKAQAEDLLSEANRKIEGTIREIRESEADKLKTREARKKLEDFRDKIQEEQADIDKPATPFIDDLKEKLDEVGRHNQRLKKQDPGHKRHREIKPKDDIIRKGDYVLLKGQETPGEVVEIRGKKANIAFGDILTIVDIVALEKISKEKYRSKRKFAPSNSSSAQWSIGKRRMSFSPSIDVRGKRADEALRMITGFIDDAVMVQNRELSILHGKGNGILRELIREYLSGQNVVASFRDEHVERGGSGITIVQLDI
jgi:DNA mismatch repair protein MutS2